MAEFSFIAGCRVGFDAAVRRRAGPVLYVGLVQSADPCCLSFTSRE